MTNSSGGAAVPPGKTTAPTTADAEANGFEAPAWRAKPKPFEAQGPEWDKKIDPIGHALNDAIKR